MNLHLSEEQELLRESFEELFAAESTPERVRAAETTGFDPGLWKQIVETGAAYMRVPEARGGAGLGLLEAALVCELAGRHLASVPLVESIVASRLLADLPGEAGASLLDALIADGAIATLAVVEGFDDTTALVPAGAVAHRILGLDGDALVAALPPDEARAERTPNLGALPFARVRVDRSAPGALVLAEGDAARLAFEAAREEWKLLVAALVGGLARRALEIAAAYTAERIQFDRPIATFQGIAHPLADAVTGVEGARLLWLEAIWAIARRDPRAGALVSMALAFGAESAATATSRSLHVHGGYGLSLEYDIQLYFRRGRAWALAGGSAQAELQEAARRLFLGAEVALPPAGEIAIDFDLGPEAAAARKRIRAFIDEHMTPELRERLHFSWDGHDPEFHKALVDAGFAFPHLSHADGGEKRSAYEAYVVRHELVLAGYTDFAIGTTGIIGSAVARFGSEIAKRDVLPRIAGGEAICSMGYTEPSAGSDVAAVSTRAVQLEDGDWLINGQKMFTSGAHIAQYVFLLTRTDPDVPKHRGLTLFLVPLDTPGIDIHPVYTIGDERTNVTYYTDVRVPDYFRVGDVHGGWQVLSYALEIEHGASFAFDQHALVHAASEWARKTRRGGRAVIDEPGTRERLARAAIHAEVAELFDRRVIWARAEGVPDQGEGSMAKLFSAERLTLYAQDLLDLAAPDSLLEKGAPGAAADGKIEFSYRHGVGTRIYAGSSEIMRSVIAQVALGMPRSRS